MTKNMERALYHAMHRRDEWARRLIIAEGWHAIALCTCKLRYWNACINKLNVWEYYCHT